MNDKELDQILRKSLRPDVSEEELEVWDRAPRMESEHTMRRLTIIKSTVAAQLVCSLMQASDTDIFQISERVRRSRTRK